MEKIQFGANDIENTLAKMNAGELDRLPFGVIQVDSAGLITKFNAAEADVTGYNPEEMIGRYFFSEVAPCTDSPQFYGRFKEEVVHAGRNLLFEYLLEKEGLGSMRVNVQIKKALGDDAYWILIKRI